MRAMRIAALLLAILVTPSGMAGQACERKALTAQRLERALALAERTRAALEASGNRVVVIARAGRDLRKYGLRYSHLGFAYRESDGAGGGRWRVLHKLNECGTARGAVFRQGLGEFFLDDLWRYETAWVPLRPAVQTHIAGLLAGSGAVLAMNEPRYSLVAYPWSQRYQQSNQWLIETLAAGLQGQTGSREPAQRWLRDAGYLPTVLRLGALERLGGRVGSANVAFDDHPDAKRFAGRIETVSADSVLSWLDRSGLGEPQVTLRE